MVVLIRAVGRVGGGSLVEGILERMKLCEHALRSLNYEVDWC